MKTIDLLKEIKHIIIGWTKGLLGIKSKKSKERLKICMACEDKKKIAGDWVCSHCYCVCKFKVLVDEEKCLKGKW